MKKIFTFLLGLMMVFAVTVSAHAVLWDRGGGLIYDDDYDITWLQDANYANTTGYDADGKMYWDDAMTWADTLSYYDSVRDYTYTDWRLPTSLNQDGSDPDSGFNVTGSEMGHLYYTEGTTAGGPGPFTNVQDWYYWSGTEYAPNPDDAWDFGLYDGYQYANTKSLDLYAWAVRTGDVVEVIPEPGTMLLLGMGLAGLAARRKRR